MDFVQWVLETFGLAGLFTLGYFLMSRNTSKILPQAMATTSQVVTGIEGLRTQVVSGIEGLRADLREDRQTDNNHNEESIQRQGAVLQGFDRVGKHMDTLTKVLEGLLTGQRTGHETAARLTEAIGGLSGTMSEMKDTMEKLNDVPTLLKEIRDALRSVEGKVDKLLTEGEAVKTETQAIKQRVEAVETAIKAQTESIPTQEVKPKTDNQEATK